MDLLARIVKPGLGLLCLAVVGCALFGTFSREKPYAFSHATHVGEFEMACDDCHYGEPETPGMPTLDDCMACHEDLDEDNPPDRRVTALFDEDEVYRAVHAAALNDEILFDHDAHADGYVEDCRACHVGIERSSRIVAADRITMNACTDCHTENGWDAADCSMCHDEIDRDWMPPEHRLGWDRRHGQIVRCEAEGTVNNCSLCHEESTCIACHRVTPPRDHNHHFRLRGHGIAASIDRTRCASCHEPDGCNRCHATTEPLSHVGSFGSPLNRHCLGCHLPLQPTNGGCTTCHRDTPSHALAPGLPPTPAHLMANDAQCRECHIPDRLRHPDNGDSCRFCHR